MPDEQRRPVRELKSTLLPPVVASVVFVMLPFFDNKVFQNSTCSKVEYCSSTCAPDSGSGASLVSTLLLKMTVLLRHGWSGGKMSMCYVAVLPPMFQPQILSMFVEVWTCKLSFSVPTKQHSIGWEVINCPKKYSTQSKSLLSPCISCFNTIIPKLLDL
jgi:hypothetical protein